jgi:prepilin-type N-terminal cleavage/methylation domain-containing protein
LSGGGIFAALYRRGGFTLVEVIVTLLIVSIVIAVSATFLLTGSNFLNRTEQNASDKALAEKAADFIKERLLYASEVKVIQSSSPPRGVSNGEVLFIGKVGASGEVELAETGRLYYMHEEDPAPVDVFGNALYRDNELALGYKATVTESAVASAGSTKSAIFEADAKVIREGKQTQNAKQIFRLPNVGPASEPTADLTVTTWDRDDQSRNEKFYLLITPMTGGYVQTDLIAHFDAIDNSTDRFGKLPHHDANQTTVWNDISGNNNDMELHFNNTGYTGAHIRDRSIYFSGGSGTLLDYGVIPNLDLSPYSAVTVEVCFRIGDTTRTWMLFEHSNNWNSNNGGFGVVLNSTSSVYGSDSVHTNFYRTNASGTLPINYKWVNQDERFTTHTNSYNMVQNEAVRRVWIEGEGPQQLYATGGITSPSESPVNSNSTTNLNAQPFYIASRAGTSGGNVGEIASVRIYGRTLTDDEVKKNASEDKLRFGF